MGGSREAAVIETLQTCIRTGSFGPLRDVYAAGSRLEASHQGGSGKSWRSSRSGQPSRAGTSSTRHGCRSAGADRACVRLAQQQECDQCSSGVQCRDKKSCDAEAGVGLVDLMYHFTNVEDREDQHPDRGDEQ